MTIIWLLIVAAILAVLFITKLSDKKHKMAMSFLVIAGLFIIITFALVARANSVDLWSFNGFFSGVQTYFFWLGHVFDNLRVITGNMVRMDWLSVK